MNVKPRTKLSKTYDKGSKHNIYDANTVQAGIRMPRQLKRKIQKWCEQHGVEFTEAVRQYLEEKFGSIVLTSEDLFLIAQQTKEQEERNAKKIGK